MKRLTMTLAALAFAAPALAQQARIYPDSLAYSAPDAAAEAFVDRFAEQDYFAVYFLLTPGARDDFFKTFATMFSLEIFFAGPDGAVPPGSVMDTTQDEAPAILSERALTFDNLVIHADEAGWLPFNVSPDAEIVSIEHDGSTALATVATGTEPVEIALNLLADEAGVWKIDRVDWDGSDPNFRPWGIAQN